MSPEHARVFLAEDNAVYRLIIERQLIKAGHNLLLTADSLSSALQKIKLFEGLDINTALVDGNLDAQDITGKDGEALIAAIRKYAPDVLIVGVGASEVRGADTNVVKSTITSDSKKLSSMVRELETSTKVR